ncbi:MAG: glycosyltransferase family 4 protein [Burkholderiaceae bacterium]|nr:glycosyltransferase family 4 protein [Burkholderiaceae bacterium]
MLHLGIDASNIRQGGGVTHLSQLLSAADPAAAGIERITVWAARSTAAALPARPWLEVRSPAWLEAGMPRRMFGQQFQLAGELKQAGCGVLFSPGGTLPLWCSIPMVTMSQNMLPFEPAEALRFGRWSGMRLKMWMLRRMQGRSFRRADGVIFLTRYAQQEVCRFLGGVKGRTALIPHGIENRFVQPPRLQQGVDRYSPEQPFRFLYVSILMPYKHQMEVALAISLLRGEGLPVAMRFVGGDWGDCGREFRRLLQRLDPDGEYLHWVGGVPFDQLSDVYREADAFVFASSCENLPNVMIEAMASGLPIASSNRGPMSEVLEGAGIYFDPEVPESIAEALRRLIHNVELRTQLAASAWQKGQSYSWVRCARETLEFIAETAEAYPASAR